MSNRSLFFSVMRRPEMQMLRAALWDMKWDKGIEWRAVTELAITPPVYASDCWYLQTDHHMLICSYPQEAVPDFTLIRLHDADDEFCACEGCKDSRLCYIRCKDVYTANA